MTEGLALSKVETSVAHCAKCNHQWRLTIKLPMELARCLTVLRGFVAAGCPRCGAHGKDVLCGPAPKKARA